MYLSWVNCLLLLLFIVSLFDSKSRAELYKRNSEDWIIDAVSLFCYFVLMPIAQIAFAYGLFSFLLPTLKGVFSLNWASAMFLFMLLDYGWYWNHRFFHARTPLWNLHAAHHETKHLDFLASQRNSIGSFLLMIYFWAYPLILFVSKDPALFLVFGAFGAVINFWGHTRLDFPRNSTVRKILSWGIIQPEDHFWHHSASNTYCNFATVFNFWDKIHGTWYQPNIAPIELGYDWKLPLWRKIFFPTGGSE